MALALRVDELIRRRVLRDYTDLAMLGKISKARATQLMNLLNLAPDLQECLLFLPPVTAWRDPITERHLRPITRMVDWQEQRDCFATLFSDCPLAQSSDRINDSNARQMTKPA